MPSKKITSKAKLHHIPGEPHLQRCNLVIQKLGGEPFGDIVVELCGLEAPKACELFLQNISSNPSATGSVNEKANQRGKQSTYRNCAMKRLTKIGLQTGETNPPARQVSASDMELEVGKLAHSYGVLSLCRCANSFDGAQFFFCLTEDPQELEHLNKKHVAFAKVVGGMTVLQRLVTVLEEGYLDEEQADGIISKSCPYVLAEVTPFAATSIQPSTAQEV